MRYSILGYNLSGALELNLDLTDLSILRWFDDFRKTGKMFSKVYQGDKYYWIFYERIAEDIPILYIKKSAIYKRLYKLVQKNILKKIIVKKCGVYTFYAIGENYQYLTANNTQTNMPPAKNDSFIKIEHETPDYCDFEASYYDDSDFRAIEATLNCHENAAYPFDEIHYDRYSSDYRDEINDYSSESSNYHNEINNYSDESNTYHHEVNSYSNEPDTYLDEINKHSSEPSNYHNEINNYHNEPDTYHHEVNKHSDESNIYHSDLEQDSAYHSSYPSALEQNSAYHSSYPSALEQDSSYHSSYPSDENQKQNDENLEQKINKLNSNNSDSGKLVRFIPNPTEIAMLMFQKIKSVGIQIPFPRIEDWISVFDDMIKNDGKSPFKIVELIRWIYSPTYSWCYRILDPYMLKANYDKLISDKNYDEKINGKNPHTYTYVTRKMYGEIDFTRYEIIEEDSCYA